MNSDHINCPIRPRVMLDDPDEPLEMIGFTIARCKFAFKRMRETDDVLEVGCGEGFGCNFFSQHVWTVTRMDIDEELIERCARRYGRENRQFVTGDVIDPVEQPEPRFHVVVSFEMIEHVGREEGRRMVANCAACLRSRSLLILSTHRAREDRSVSRQHMHVLNTTTTRWWPPWPRT